MAVSVVEKQKGTILVARLAVLKRRIGKGFLTIPLVVICLGCRTNGVLQNVFGKPLKQEPLSAGDVTPKLVSHLQAVHEKGVQHWTTGGPATPGPYAPPINHVLPRDFTLDRYSLSSGEVASDEPLDTEFPAIAGGATAMKLSIEEAIQLALANNTVIRRDADFVVSRSRILSVPEQVSTSLNPSITDSGFLFGQRGAAAALSDFDSQIRFQTVWGRDEAIQNNLFLSGGILPGGALVEETASSVLEVVRDTRSGGRSRLFHSIAYDASNRQDLLFPSSYRLAIGAEFRQPLLAGAGRLYTDVAGSPSDQIRGVTGVAQGVMIAKKQTQVAELDLRIAVAELVSDLQSVYWELKAADECVQLVEETLDRTEEYVQMADARLRTENDINEIERLTLFEQRLNLRQTQRQQEHRRHTALSRIRRLTGLPPAADLSVVPTEPFIISPIIFDRISLELQATDSRPEIQKQRLQISSIDLQIRAAQSLLLPQLDGIVRYQVNGFGDSLARETVPGPDEDIQSAYGNLFQGDFSGWQLGFEFSQRYGRRLERTRIRNLRLQAQKERVLLDEQRQEIRHELTLLLDELEHNTGERELIQLRLETLRSRRDVVQERFAANDKQITFDQLVAADTAVLTIEIELINNLASYGVILARLNQASGHSLHEAGIFFR